MVEEIKKLEQKLEKNIDAENGNPLINLEKLYKHMEKIVAIAKPFTPCVKKCPECCKIDVSLSEWEIHLIEKYLIKNKIKTITKIKENITTIFENEMKGNFLGYQCGGKECPFLIDERCIIYKVRPYFCREYMVLEDNNKKCGYNDNFAIQLSQFIKRDIYFNIITQNNNNPVYNNKISFEIRDCFSKAI